MCADSRNSFSPGKPVHIIEELAECDFGEFENKNYKELEGNAKYQAWIDSSMARCRFRAERAEKRLRAGICEDSTEQ